MNGRASIPTLLLIAALALLPAWFVGCAALGAALGLWIATSRRTPEEASAPPVLDNVITLSDRRGR